MADTQTANDFHNVDATYDGGAPAGYTRLTDTASDPAYAENGVDGAAFVNNDTGEVTVAFAGHDPSKDWRWTKKDYGIWRGDVHTNDGIKKYSEKFLEQVKKQNRDENGAITNYEHSSIRTTGFSEGGTAAQIIAQSHGYPGTSFGAPGLTGYTRGSPAEGANFHNYMGSEDPIAQFSSDGSLSTDLNTPADHYGTTQTVGPGGLDNRWPNFTQGTKIGNHTRDKYKKDMGIENYKKTSARKDNSNIMITKGPDVLKTPIGGQMVPVAYNSLARLGQGQRLASSVFVNGRQDFHLDSRSEIIQGHQPGTGKGVVVPGYEKFSHAKTASPTVFSEGFGEVRDRDPAWINHPTVGPEEQRRPKGSPSILPLLWAQKHPQGADSP